MAIQVGRVGNVRLEEEDPLANADATPVSPEKGAASLDTAALGEAPSRRKWSARTNHEQFEARGVARAMCLGGGDIAGADFAILVEVVDVGNGDIGGERGPVRLRAGHVAGSHLGHGRCIAHPGVANLVAEEEYVVGEQARVRGRLDDHLQPLLLNGIVGPDDLDAVRTAHRARALRRLRARARPRRSGWLMSWPSP